MIPVAPAVANPLIALGYALIFVPDGSGTVNATVITGLGEALAFLVAGWATVWARRAASKTDYGNDKLGDIKAAVDGLGRKMTRLETAFDDHVEDVARVRRRRAAAKAAEREGTE